MSLDTLLKSLDRECVEDLPEVASLISCARHFKEVCRQYGEPEYAFGSCTLASLGFIVLLERMGLVTEKQLETGEVGRACTSRHEWVKYGRIMIDWTARQYDPNAPFPKVWIDRSAEIKVMPLP